MPPKVATVIAGARRVYRKVRRAVKIAKGVKMRPYYRPHYSPYSQALKPAMFRNSLEVSLTGNATGTLGTGYGRTFKFDDITDVTDIMGLYDQYKIHSIEVKFIPAWNVAGNSANVNAPMYIVVDPMNGSAPTSAAEMLNYSKVKKRQINTPWKMTFTPFFFQSVGVVSSNEYCTKPTTDFWLSNTDTVAYGLRIWTDPINSNSAPIGTLVYTYNILAKFQS